MELRDNVSSHAPVDPALVLPPAVQAQRDRANAMMAAMQQPPSQPQQSQLPQPPAPPGTPSDQLVNGDMLQNPSTPTNPGQQPFDLTLPQAPSPPTQQGQPSPTPPPAPQEPPASAEEWERRYHSINGRYQSELPRMRDAVQQLSDRNDQLERLLASTAQPSPAGTNGHGPGTGRGPDAPPLTADFTPQEIEDWGPEILGMIQRVANNRSHAMVEQVRPHIQQTQQTARQQMIDYLDQHVPNWQDINVSQEFMNWALLPDDFSGAIRRDLLRRWWEANNGPRVATFFRSFISGLPGGPATPQPQPAPPAPAPTPQAPASNRLSLQELAAPSGTGSAAAVPPAPAAKRVYKRSEIAQFYQSRSLGHFRGREQEAQAVENDIFAAQRENRVVNG